MNRQESTALYPRLHDSCASLVLAAAGRLDRCIRLPAPVPLFGWIALLPIWSKDRALSDELISIHRLIGMAIACLVAAHVAGALYHHFVRRDRVLMRMISG